jgi:hypothetical protein
VPTAAVRTATAILVNRPRARGIDPLLTMISPNPPDAHAFKRLPTLEGRPPGVNKGE